MKPRNLSAGLMALLLLIVCLTTTSQASSVSIRKVTGLIETVNPTSFELFVVPPGNTFSRLSLPDTLHCVTDFIEPWGTPETYACPVVWQPQAVDWSTPGRKSVPGKLMPQNGYALADTFDGSVSYPVFVEGELGTPEMLTGSELIVGETLLLPVGSDVSQLDLSLVNFYFYTNVFGECLVPAVTWDTSAIDTSKPGTYIVSGTVRLPKGFVLPPGFKGFSFSVGVVRPDCIDLSAVMKFRQEGVLVCEWLYALPDKSKVRLDYAIGDGAWKRAPQVEYGRWLYGYLNWGGTSLTIDLKKLELFTDYWFRLVENGMPSSAIHIRLEDNNFVFAEPGSGGDQGGTPLPPVLQPTPTENTSVPDAKENIPHTAGGPNHAKIFSNL